jgi:(2Fe-2S) ferredoxin
MEDKTLNLPTMMPYSRHLLFCTGRYCDPEGKAEALCRALPRLLGKLGRYDNPQRVKRGTCPCLGVCYGGPIAVVYPDGIWYHVPDEAALKRIVEEHLRGGIPVDELIFHRLGD